MEKNVRKQRLPEKPGLSKRTTTGQQEPAHSGIVDFGDATKLTKGKGGRSSEAHNPRP